jgi:hypothetical protein
VKNMLELFTTLTTSDITAAVPMSAATKDIVGGGGIIAYLIKKAFQNGAKKVIIAA